MRSGLVLLTGALGLASCQLAREPLLGASGADGGVETPDVGVRLDAAPPDLDAGGVDADRPDVGVAPVDAPECTGSVTRCDAETLVTCVDGRFVFDDCASRASFCDGTQCVAQACVPGFVECMGPMESRCDARGTVSSVTACTRGCTAAVGCNAVTACALPIAGAMGTGTLRVDTCAQGDDSVFNSGCTRTDRSGSDLVVRLEVPARADYRIELLVIGGADAVLYVRRACADGTTELACDDDTAAGFGSRVDLTLDPGDYFLMLDSFRDTEGPDGRCGEMDLVVSLR